MLVKEPFNFTRDMLRNTTMRWKYDLVDSQRKKPPKPPQSAEEVYESMLALGLSLTQPSSDPQVERARVAKAEEIARKSADAFRRKHAQQKAAKDRGR